MIWGVALFFLAAGLFCLIKPDYVANWIRSFCSAGWMEFGREYTPVTSASQASDITAYLYQNARRGALWSGPMGNIANIAVLSITAIAEMTEHRPARDWRQASHVLGLLSKFSNANSSARALWLAIYTQSTKKYGCFKIVILHECSRDPCKITVAW
jgi:hypothetical protein